MSTPGQRPGSASIKTNPDPGALPRATLVSPVGETGNHRLRFMAMAGAVEWWIRADTDTAVGIQAARRRMLGDRVLPRRCRIGLCGVEYGVDSWGSFQGDNIMPVYEFYCPDCHAIFNFFSRRVDTETQPACPRCGRPELGRQASLFAISRGGERSPSRVTARAGSGLDFRLGNSPSRVRS